jgi:hypothetical protein
MFSPFPLEAEHSDLGIYYQNLRFKMQLKANPTWKVKFKKLSEQSKDLNERDRRDSTIIPDNRR